ncbi:MAG TPA: helix-turn-helix transcriptional regulator [Bacteroidia bacterium]|nr:helix-turn-helix transcriptional regulator [Bacteroidia bacterium]
MKKKYDIVLVVGDNIRKIRTSQDISQNQLAYETGLSREFINRVESGKNNISLKKLALIAEALNISPKKLFD